MLRNIDWISFKIKACKYRKSNKNHCFFLCFWASTLHAYMLRFFSKNLSEKIQKNIQNHTKFGSATLRKTCCQTCFKKLEFLSKMAPKIDKILSQKRKNREKIGSRSLPDPLRSLRPFRTSPGSLRDLNFWENSGNSLQNCFQNP